MENKSRTAKSIINARISMFYYFAFLIVGFWSRKVFFDYLGSEILGLDTTASNLLGMLNLAEMGIGMSVAYFLYKPLYDGDHNTINKIVTLQGWLYRRIATFILIASAILMCFFPRIFAEAEVPIWCPYATFIVMLFGSLLGYYVNYRQIVLQADQKTYKVTQVTQGANLVFKIFVVIIMPYVSNPFIWYLGMNLLGSLFSCLWLNHTIKKEYPWLNENGLKGKEVLKEYPEVITKTKQLFIHRIAGVIYLNICPFLMYAFTTLTVVAYYGNYLLIIERFATLIRTVFGSTGAGIGNLIAEADKERIKKVFWELFDSRLFMSWVALFSIYFLVQPFITIWLGSDYLLGEEVVALLVVQQAIAINRTTVDSFLAGNGQFSDIWSPIAEGIATFVFAYGLGFLMGIAGVLLGIILAQTIFIGFWKPYFLFVKGFNFSWKDYFLPFGVRCCIIGIAAFVYRLLFLQIFNLYASTYLQWGLNAVIVTITITVTLFIPFYLLAPGMRDFVARMIGLIKTKKR